VDVFECCRWATIIGGDAPLNGRCISIGGGGGGDCGSFLVAVPNRHPA